MFMHNVSSTEKLKMMREDVIFKKKNKTEKNKTIHIDMNNNILIRVFECQMYTNIGQSIFKFSQETREIIRNIEKQ